MEAKREQAKKTISREVENTQIYLDALEDESDRMSDWENEFVESVSDSFTHYGSLTVAQYNKLEEIYRRYF